MAAGGALTTQDQRLLIAAVEALHERIQPDLWRDDQAAYFRASDLLQVGRYVEIAADAA